MRGRSSACVRESLVAVENVNYSADSDECVIRRCVCVSREMLCAACENIVGPATGYNDQAIAEEYARA